MTRCTMRSNVVALVIAIPVRVLGSGAVRAQTEARTFETVEDIMKVSGIGEKAFECIRDHVVVEVTKD